MARYTFDFREIGIASLPDVGGKNASMGEMFRKLTGRGVKIPDGFATRAKAYWTFLDSAGIRSKLSSVLEALDTLNYSNLAEVGLKCRRLVLEAPMPLELEQNILFAFRALKGRTRPDITVAVRSSATAEDLPTASFAGQLESYLNVRGDLALIEACRKCYASLFTDRAIQYRSARGFKHMDIAVSVGVQAMVRSDMACSGVGFTLEPESGHPGVIVLTGNWGLGENVVQGKVTPDQFTLFKASLKSGQKSIVSRKLGAKEYTMTYAEAGAPAGDTTVNTETAVANREVFILSDREVEELGRTTLRIEEHYGRPMDIEWAKDGKTGEIFIVQARPETVQAGKWGQAGFRRYEMGCQARTLAKGVGLGGKIAAGRARILTSPKDTDKLQEGEVLVTGITTPDWDPIMKKAAAIITDKGGRTSHAAIIAREMGKVAVVGTGGATSAITDGQEVTVSCAEGETGVIYEGRLPWKETEIDPGSTVIPKTRTKPMLILSDPDRAFSLAGLPNQGVGMMRLEPVIANSIRIHPMALARFDELKEGPEKEQIQKLTRNYASMQDFFIDNLAEAVATVAAAFHPRDVVVRLSDFKPDESAGLLGGTQFESKEDGSLLGLRGAARYCHPAYRDGFRLECLAIRKVREEMGFRNVKVMLPSCGSVEEGRRVIELMAKNGLKRGEDGLEISVMVDISDNILLEEDFARTFDGCTIGSKGLSQKALGLDRAIRLAKQGGVKIGLCGQGPSDDPEFARFLVERGIDSISFNPDALWKGLENIQAAEKEMQPPSAS